ncbi:DNA methyltransferase [Mycobacterium phage Shauna1]|uniref:DNA methylase n=2 Tax=Mycobacterium virus Shauna1 TaxID=1993889 RepID=G1DU53_9CAUD|nr:DNA methyltransferase [Mycobacterium phage Shauna1]AEJ93043.1 DNA methylase [Mycobacterium phage Shauna1]QIQ63760.1 DNA methylase [Mycobacterium phage Phanphagia]
MNHPYYQDDQVTLYHGDALDVLAELPDRSVDAVVCDPPYELDFMGKKWDGSGIAFDVEMWKQCLRVLKPGGHLLAFGGSRTWHRLTVAIEDAGFEIRDSIAWLYGQGMPKSLDVSKAIDKAAGAEREVIGKSARHVSGKPGQRTEGLNGSSTFAETVGMGAYITAPATEAARQWQGWNTALKPSFEPVVVARKPLAGTVAANVLEHGTGALNIDACRIEAKGRPHIASASEASAGVYGNGLNGSKAIGTTDLGRWPTNVVLDDTQAAELDAQSGITRSHGGGLGTGSRKPAQGVPLVGGIATTEHLDVGGASRFFPVFKYQAKAPTKERPGYVNEDGAKVVHSTVKPLDLMRWLVRLVTPPNGVVLDPFAGSGTTAEACIHEHKRCITIEREADYLPLIVARLSKPIEVGFDFGDAAS